MVGVDLENLPRNNTFETKCSIVTPQAIYCFLISNGFEEAIRKALSIVGDSDTIAVVTSSIAEAYYGLDESLALKVRDYLPDYVLNIIDEFYRKKGMKIYVRSC